MTGLVEKLIHGRTSRAQFARYALIGSTVFCIDVGSFWLFIRLSVPLLPAITGSYGLAVLVHFTLNKYWSFRAFDRSLNRQARTYLVVAGILYFTTIAMTAAAVRLAHMTPLVARIGAVVINIPISFLAHKYLTFGGGILRTFRNLVR